MLNKIRQLLATIKAVFIKDEFFIETRLPQGVTEFHQWADSIIAKSGLPNNDSMKHALAMAITRLGGDVSRIPKMYFVQVVEKAAAMQVAFHIKDEFINKKKAAEATAALQKTTETAATQPISATT